MNGPLVFQSVFVYFYILCLHIFLPFPSFFTKQVVSTVVSGILFACFVTVECISKGCSLLLWPHSCSKKVPVGKESELSRGGAITLYGWNILNCRKNEQKEWQILQLRLLNMFHIHSHNFQYCGSWKGKVLTGQLLKDL